MSLKGVHILFWFNHLLSFWCKVVVIKRYNSHLFWIQTTREKKFERGFKFPFHAKSLWPGRTNYSNGVRQFCFCDRRLEPPPSSGPWPIQNHFIMRNHLGGHMRRPGTIFIVGHISLKRQLATLRTLDCAALWRIYANSDTPSATVLLFRFSVLLGNRKQHNSVLLLGAVIYIDDI